MENNFNQVMIFVPLLVVVGLTVFGFVWLALARIRTTRARDLPLSYYRAFQNGTEPLYVAVAARHYMNLFEAPVLFYAACITAFALQGVTLGIYLTAWGYVVFRLAQSAIHLTYNNVRHRALAFLFGWFALTALWVQIAIALFKAL